MNECCQLCGEREVECPLIIESPGSLIINLYFYINVTH